jgi:para-aminobenzoate synthetase component 1
LREQLRPSLAGHRPIELPFSPAEAAGGLCHCPGFLFLDSAGNLPGNYPQPLSILAAFPEATLHGSLHEPGDRARLQAAVESRTIERPDCGFPLGGAFGTIDYDGRYHFGLYPNLLVHAHRSGQWFEVGTLARHLRASRPASPPVRTSWTSNFTRDEFLAAVRTAQEYIAAGDIYQVNLSQRFRTCLPEGSADRSFFPLYERLRQFSPAPMAAYFHTGAREILSSSPETFLRLHGTSIETRPIKGTRPRFNDPEADSRSAFELQTSEKEIAELVMITDLERNDLGQVCEFGSVKVSEMLKLERLEQVYHLISTVTGQLRPGISHLDALAACFPGGSITGAPKIRATEIIAALEPSPRGLYTGAIGYLGFNRESQFNIAIRTLVRDIVQDSLSYHVGAGIVADSDPEAEYEETLLKAEGLRLALGS